MLFLFVLQFHDHIDDYIANHIDDPIDIVPFLDLHQASLTLIWVGFLRVRFEVVVGGGGGELPLSKTH